MATTGNIYSSYIGNFLCGLTGEVHFKMSDGQSGNTDTLFAKNAFDSIPAGSTINRVNIIFDGALSRDNTSRYKGSIKITEVGCFPTWDGTYSNYESLPWDNKQILWSGEFNTDSLPYHYATYTHSLTGISLAQLKSGLLVRVSYRYVTSGILSYDSEIYVRNFHVTVDYTPPTPFTVNFNGNGATNGSVASFSKEAEVDFALPANGFSKQYVVTYNPGYSGSNIATAYSSATFKGWEDHGSITAHTDEIFDYTQFDAPYYANKYTDLYNAFKYNKRSLINHYVDNGRKEGRSCIGNPRGVYPERATVNSIADDGGSTTLYAQWSDMSEITFPSPQRTGYVFLGWYTAPNGGTKVGNAGTKYTPTGNATCYAHWEAIGLYIGSAAYDVYQGTTKLDIYQGTTKIQG